MICWQQLSRRRTIRCRRRRLMSHNMVDSLESRLLLAADFGDAPDTSAGTGTGNYTTLSINGGPSHVTDLTQTTLFLGDTVDGDSGTLQNAKANADDTNNAFPDDEDGVLNPLDLLATVGAQPQVTLLATNNTGSAGTLYGWIDYNQNGVFENATERTSVSVPDGTTDGRFTLSFPSIPVGSVGSTYARFRLSTDAAAADPTGSATDGEVEDHAFRITSQSSGTVDSFVKITDQSNGGPALADGDRFGISADAIGDLDGDGVQDVAVGAFRDDTGGTDRGAVYVLFMNSDGTVKSSTKIASGTNGGPTLADGDRFGSSVAGIGDLDGDGVNEIVVGAYLDNTGGTDRGAIYVLFMNSDGTVRSSTKVASGLNVGLTALEFSDGDRFGTSVTGIGDFNGDGQVDIAVGAKRDATAGYQKVPSTFWACIQTVCYRVPSKSPKALVAAHRFVSVDTLVVLSRQSGTSTAMELPIWPLVRSKMMKQEFNAVLYTWFASTPTER